ncbi:MAG: molybdopterin-dependent oxidoreductase [Anaerolineales bacterium]
MRKFHIGMGFLVGVLLAAPLTAVLYLANQLFDLAFIPFDLFNWVTKILPGPLVTFGIDLMIDTLLFLGINVADAAKTAEQMMAVFGFFVLATLLGAGFYIYATLSKSKPGIALGLIMGALFGLPMIAVSIGVGSSVQNPFINILWLVFLFAVWGILLSQVTARLLRYEVEETQESMDNGEVQRLNRRQFLITLGATSASVTVVGAGLAAILERADRSRQLLELEDSKAHKVESPEGKQLPNIDDPVTPAPGTRPEYTPLKDHYEVFIEVEPTVIEGDTWHLPVTGLVETPLMLTLNDLRENYPSRSQYITISCISGRVGTSLIGTTLWEGVSVHDVLADAGLKPEARYLKINSGDGFYETVPLELIDSDERIMFCYNWDGNPLPIEHGFPLRIWIPDRYGMKQPKWITSVEVTDIYEEGYWVERGWDEIAQVKATSVIDTVAVNAIEESGGEQLVPIGGIAFSGDRGISKVEVRMDGGPWQEARLRSPLSETTWVIWRYDWPYKAGDHTFEVRCEEGDGTPQIAEVAKARPSGATGYHMKEASL